MSTQTGDGGEFGAAATGTSKGMGLDVGASVQPDTAYGVEQRGPPEIPLGGLGTVWPRTID
ncbi:MAG: hypothetical protein M3143_05215 [Actinomycetota bacterium]|nr:hypothetical protein [Actinomycetota bacterium]